MRGRGASLRASQARSMSSRLQRARSEEHTSELQSHLNLVCRLLLEKKKHLSELPCGCNKIRLGLVQKATYPAGGCQSRRRVDDVSIVHGEAVGLTPTPNPLLHQSA